MYAEHYDLSGRPFQLSPDHRFFFRSRSHTKALAYLSFGLNEREGFIVISGDVGAGKTTLVGHLTSQIDREQYVLANVVTTQLEADDALRMVASAFGIDFEESNKATLLRGIERFLLDQHALGKHVLLVVDEAQNMTPSALEELRMLSNFQADGKALIQCFLLGQPQFRAIMAHPAMEQLLQRVIASCHLEPMDLAETRSYIEHRLRMVGWDSNPVFSSDAFEMIQIHSGGVPRRINTLCGRLLLFGALENLHEINSDVVLEVVNELADEGTQHSSTIIPEPDLENMMLPSGRIMEGLNEIIPSGPWPSVQSYSDALRTLDDRVARLKPAD
jgi:putative secretion ATPase (PEP-CTERM system associated)